MLVTVVPDKSRIAAAQLCQLARLIIFRAHQLQPIDGQGDDGVIIVTANYVQAAFFQLDSEWRAGRPANFLVGG